MASFDSVLDAAVKVFLIVLGGLLVLGGGFCSWTNLRTIFSGASAGGIYWILLVVSVLVAAVGVAFIWATKFIKRRDKADRK